MSENDIAIVGMACRFPGARNVDEYWQNLRDGVESSTQLSDHDLKSAGVGSSLLNDPNYIKSGHFLDDVDMFDGKFFGFSPKESSIMDPQHRHFLECSWEAFEHAGHTPEGFDGSIGVFAGCGMNAYFMFNVLTNPDLVASTGLFLLRHTGNDKDFLSTRVSYEFNLTGPSVNVQTACSTSLVAIHQGIQSLLNGECDMALAGGVTIELPQRVGYLYKEGEILSKDGHCRPFDHASTGTLFGSGVGVVVLRRLEDALKDGDTIHAVIKGSAINNDGSTKVGYLAPSVDGQSGAIAEALEIADVNPESISYVEAHGTGTAIGDPIEVTALTQAYRNWTDQKQYCGLGSVKSNIGHLDTAAGVASVIKSVLAMEHRQLPPTLFYEKANPNIDFENSPFFVNDRLRDWDTEQLPRRSGVSSLGVGGTNAHLILEEAPELAPTSTSRDWQLLVWSARSKEALDDAAINLAEYLDRRPDANLADVSHTLQIGRRGFGHRRMLVSNSAKDAVQALKEGDKKRVKSAESDDSTNSVAFMFPGGGAQYPQMGADLYRKEAVYRDAVDRALKLLEPELSANLRALMLPEDDAVEAAAKDLESPRYSILSIFIVEYALAKLWISWGIEPVAMTGHSLGEYTAACLSGVMSLEVALGIVDLRGKIFEKLPVGGMLSVSLTEEEVKPYLGDGISLAAINAPELTVVAGEADGITALQAKLESEDIDCKPLKISVAAHSPMLEPYLQEFHAGVAQFELNPPTIPFVSNRTGKWITAEEATNPDYWVKHLRHTVRFADGMREILKDPNWILLEVGPGNIMSSLARLQPEKVAKQPVIASLRHPQEVISDEEFILKSLGEMWILGKKIDWSKLRGEEVRRRIPVPSYPWQHEPHWIEPGKPSYEEAGQEDPLARIEDPSRWFSTPTWSASKPSKIPEIRLFAEPLSWLVFTDGNPACAALIKRLSGLGQTVLTVEVGDSFARTGEGSYQLAVKSEEDYKSLVRELKSAGEFPDKVIHLWTLSGTGEGEAPLAAWERVQDLGFNSLYFFARALAELTEPPTFELTVVTSGSAAVEDERVCFPAKATVHGPCKVIPKEFPEIGCKCIDLPVEVAESDLALDWVLGEVCSDASEPLVAFRDGERWIRSLHPYLLTDEISENEGRLRREGVYLITGGLGGIGMIMAEYLAKQISARLILTSRTGLPPRDEWERIQSESDPMDAALQSIHRVRHLESLGAEVLVLAADVTDAGQMRDVVQAGNERFGDLNGVIHAAGILEDGLIATKDVDSVNRVMAAKGKGTLVLADVLAAEHLDVMVLFSSISSELGAPGQIDYTAANDFLNAFARSELTSNWTYTVAVNWGPWSEVGMALKAAEDGGLVEQSIRSQVTYSEHSLLDKRIEDQNGEIVYETDLRVEDHWILGEHRIKGRGSVLPGTGYFELIKGALEDGKVDGPVMFRNLLFIAPLDVKDDESLKVRVSLTELGDHYQFQVASKRGENEEGESLWLDHAQGLVGYIDEPELGARSIDEISERCDRSFTEYEPDSPQTKQEDHLDFGPRWRCLSWARFGKGESIACLELDGAFSKDLASFDVHPALLDIATGYALPLLDGYDQSGCLYVPMMYDEVRVFSPLPRKIYSHVRLHGDGSSEDEIATFDITILNEEGRPVIEVDQFSVRRLAEKHALDVAETHPEDLHVLEEDRNQDKRTPSEMNLLELGVRDGIRPAEGAQALARILNACQLPEVAVCSLDVHAMMQRIAGAGNGASGAGRGKRKKQSGGSGAPKGNIERTIAGIWGEHLGIEQVGRDEEFFDLGGHSLLGVRVTNQLNSVFGTSYAPVLLFDYATVRKYAAKLASDKPDLAETGEDEDAEPVETEKASVSPQAEVVDN